MTTKENPIKELLSDKDWQVLNEANLINHKSVRDYLIRVEYQKLRDSKESTRSAFETVAMKYPYLKKESVRKIVYKKL